jgi:hypothetical protein
MRSGSSISSADDPYLSTLDEAQAALLRDIDDWESYVRAARVEPHG